MQDILASEHPCGRGYQVDAGANREGSQATVLQCTVLESLSSRYLEIDRSLA